MATPPFGTLCFSGWGDDPFEFRNVNGGVVAPPASNPIAGSGCDGIVSLSNGRICVVGGNSPNFGTTGVGIFSTDFLTPTQFLTSPFPGVGISKDDSDNFYGVRSATRILYKYTAAGTQTVVTAAMAATSINAFTVNGAGTICYFVLTASRDTIRAWDLVGNVSLGVITTETGFQATGNNCLYSDTNGDLFVGWDRVAAGTGYVKRYNSTGVLQQTYTLPGTSQTPICITAGLTPRTFWVCYYNASSITSSGVTVIEFNILTGIQVQAPFDPEDGAFQFDASFAVLGFSEITYLWTKVSGPGTVVFADATALNSTVTFSAVGVYVLRLSATSSCQTMTDDVTITVLGGETGNCVLPSADPVFSC